MPAPFMPPDRILDHSAALPHGRDELDAAMDPMIELMPAPFMPPNRILDHVAALPHGREELDAAIDRMIELRSGHFIIFDGGLRPR